MEKVNGCLAELVAYNGSLQIAHWLADTATNEHKALGELYEAMIDLTDNFAEVYMGKHGVISFPDDTEIEDITDAPVAAGLQEVERLQGYFEAGKDDDLLNILADMQSALNKAKYLLKETSKPIEKSEEPEEKEEKEEAAPIRAVGMKVKIVKAPPTRIASILKKKFSEEA